MTPPRRITVLALSPMPEEGAGCRFRIAQYLPFLREAGFDVTDLVEWGPSADDLAGHPEWEIELERPMILLIGATRR